MGGILEKVSFGIFNFSLGLEQSEVLNGFSFGKDRVGKKNLAYN